MSIRRHRAALLTGVVVTALVASSAATSGATTTAAGGDLPRPVAQLARSGYPPAPQVVQGLNDDLFLGLEFDYYCALRGHKFDKGLRRLGQLANDIAQSGRRVMFTAAPNKSLVVTHSIDRSVLPQGSCDTAGMRHQARAMDDFDDPLFLPLRRHLAHDSRQVYYKTDHHWTSVGGSVFAEQVAERLSPRLASRQHYRAGTETALGVLNAMLGIWVPEVAEAAFPDNGVLVRTAPGSDYWDSLPNVVLDHSWTSSPARKTWRGHTLVIGDSFAIHALETLRPLFRHGRFMWTSLVKPADMASAIAASDTVVIEVYQTGVTASPLNKTSFHRQVRRALHAADSGG